MTDTVLHMISWLDFWTMVLCTKAEIRLKIMSYWLRHFDWPDFYKLDKYNVPVPVQDVSEWLRERERTSSVLHQEHFEYASPDPRVMKEHMHIRLCFLGMDHQVDRSVLPELFEVMVDGNQYGEETFRFATYGEAIYAFEQLRRRFMHLTEARGAAAEASWRQEQAESVDELQDPPSTGPVL